MLLSIFGLAEAGYVLLREAGVIYDFSGNPSMGSFSNPAPMGCFVAVSLVATVGLIIQQKSWRFKSVLLISIEYYETASSMIPLKLLPRYHLFLLLVRERDYDKATIVWNSIIIIPNIVESSKPILIKDEVKKNIDGIQLIRLQKEDASSS